MQERDQHLQDEVQTLQARIQSLERDLEQLNLVKDDFLSLAAHELRTPMTVIRESVAQLQDGLYGQLNDEQRKILHLALKNIDGLAEAVNAFIARSKMR